MKRTLSVVLVAVLVGLGVLVPAVWLSGVVGGDAVAQEAPADESAEGRGLVVNITTDDTWSANMALSLAQRAAEDGLDTIVFLNVRGVYLGHAGRMPATEGNSDLNVHEKLQAVVAAGGRVIACPSCSMEAGLTQEDYIEGVVVGEPGGILQFLGSPDFNVISYPQPTPAVG